MNTHTTLGRRLVGVLGAAAIGLIGLVGAAHAEEAPSYGNIVQEATGSITIHKFAENNASEASPDSPDKPDGAGKALSAGFTIYKISAGTFDPSSPDSWDEWSGDDGKAAGIAATADICSIAAADLTGKYTKQTTVTTNAETGASEPVNELALGGYLVCETTPPANAVATAAPFVVTLPTPYDGKWVYNVHAFPKNAVNTVTKSIDPQDGLGLGSTVTFPVSTTIQALPDDQEYTSFIISDTLDSRLTNVQVASVQLGGEPLTSGTDYTVSGPSSTDNTVSVSLYPGDSASKIDAAVGKKVTVTFTGVVSSLGEDGSIVNEAVLFVNDPQMSGQGIPSNEVTTNWGDARIFKYDAESGESKTGLSGAVFEVYPADEPYAKNCQATVATDAKPVSVTDGGKTVDEFTSDRGVVTIPGLFVSDSINNDNGVSTHRCYVLKEVKAPAGFVTPTGAAALTALEVSSGKTASTVYDASISNSKQKVPELPLTGANGELLMTVGGLALVLLAGGGALVVRSRRHQS